MLREQAAEVPGTHANGHEHAGQTQEEDKGSGRELLFRGEGVGKEGGQK